MDTVKIGISGRDLAAVQETYKRIETMFEVVDVSQFEDDPGFRSLEIKRPGGGRGWAVEQLPHEGDRRPWLFTVRPVRSLFL